jgi:hypothetical protein
MSECLQSREPLESCDASRCAAMRTGLHTAVQLYLEYSYSGGPTNRVFLYKNSSELYSRN